MFNGLGAGTFEGTLTVPGRFTTTVLSGDTLDDVGGNQFSQLFMFNIDTLEGANQLKVRYQMTDSYNYDTKKRSCEGKAYFEGETEPVPFKCYKFEVAKDYLQAKLIHKD